MTRGTTIGEYKVAEWIAIAPCSARAEIQRILDTGELCKAAFKEALRLLDLCKTPGRTPGEGEALFACTVDGGPRWLPGIVCTVSHNGFLGLAGHAGLPKPSWRVVSEILEALDARVDPLAPPRIVESLPGGQGNIWGRSGDLAALIAVISAYTGIRVPDKVFSGQLEIHGNCPIIRPVNPEGLGKKQKAVETERPGYEFVSFDKEVPLWSELDKILGKQWRRLAQDESLRRQLDELRSLNLSGQAKEVIGRSEILMKNPAAKLPHFATQICWSLGAALLHSGEAERANEIFEQAKCEFERWSEDSYQPPPPSVYHDKEFLAHAGIGLLDVFQIRKARAHLERVLNELLQQQPVPATRDWRFATIGIAGSLARVCGALGNGQESIRLRQEVCLGRARLRTQDARCLADLAEDYRKAGRCELAAQNLALGRQSLSDMESDSKKMTQLFLELFRARLAADDGRWDEVHAIDPTSWKEPVLTLLRMLRLGDPDHVPNLDDAGEQVLVALDGERPWPTAAWTAVAEGVLRRWVSGERGADAVGSRLGTVTCDDPDTVNALMDLAKGKQRTAAAKQLLRRSPY